MSASVNTREGFPKAINNYSLQQHISDWLAPHSYQYTATNTWFFACLFSPFLWICSDPVYSFNLHFSDDRDGGAYSLYLLPRGSPVL